MTVAESFFTYGPGIPTYRGIWVVLTPVAVALLVAARLRWEAVAAYVAVTLSSFAVGSLPFLTPVPRYLMVTAGLVLLVAVAARAVARPRVGAGALRPVPAPVPWRALAALAVLTLAVRVPLAWIDPGISSIGLSTEHAANELLSGRNPYAQPNPFADFGTYQYPIGTVLANLPLVALVPAQVLGEEHLGLRATSWLVDVLVVAALVVGAARWGRVRTGLVAGGAFALCAPLVRDSGLSTANDLLLALLALLAALALAERRLTWAAVAVGLAIAVKPPAVLLLPLLLGAAGLVPALVAAAVPALLQAPFLLWQAPGWKAVEALAEPTARSDGASSFAYSVWYPLLSLTGGGDTVLKALALLGILASAGAASWAGRRLARGRPDLATVAAAVALPLLLVFALAPVPRPNYQDWYAPALVLWLAHAVRPSRRADRTAPPDGPPAEPERPPSPIGGRVEG